jgi:hypothetical protein
VGDTRKQVPYLLQLLDDDTVAVRRRVMHALEELGPELEVLAEPHLQQLNADQHSALRRVLTRQRKAWLREHWRRWASVEGRRARIETALSLLARFQLGVEFPLSVGDLLDGVADDFRVSGHPPDAFGLARFLFEDVGLSGNRDDFYNPLNSNLISVILSKRGIPISLVSIYMLVGRRLGMDIQGCNVPSNFLARVIHDKRIVLVDCFDRGRMVEADKLLARTPANLRQLQMLRNGADSMRTVQRVLHNLNHAYRRAGDHDLSAFMIELLGITARREVN